MAVRIRAGRLFSPSVPCPDTRRSLCPRRRAHISPGRHRRRKIRLCFFIVSVPCAGPAVQIVPILCPPHKSSKDAGFLLFRRLYDPGIRFFHDHRHAVEHKHAEPFAGPLLEADLGNTPKGGILPVRVKAHPSISAVEPVAKPKPLVDILIKAGDRKAFELSEGRSWPPTPGRTAISNTPPPSDPCRAQPANSGPYRRIPGILWRWTTAPR